MIELRTRILVGLLVLLGAAPEGSPQTAQNGPPTTQVVVRKTGKSGNNRGSAATGAPLGALPGLCFQPGVGWQSILPEPPGVPATPGMNGSIGLEVSRSTSPANTQSIYARSSSAQQAYAGECAGNSINKKVLGAGVEKFTILNRPQTMRSAGSMKPGTVTSLHVNSHYHNSSYHAKGSAVLEPVEMMPGAAPPAPTYFASEAESGAHPDQGGVRAFHAYTSSIKLRRLIRNAPDVRTRIKLQQLQNNPATQLHKATVVTRTGAAARRPLQGERANRSPSWRSDTHRRPRDKSRRLLSGAYR
jgi:hypothetical protein